MVKNCHGFIPKNYRPRPVYYKQERNNWCAIFLDADTKISYKIEIFADYMNNCKTGRYLHLYKETDDSHWEHIEGFTSIKSVVDHLRREMGLPPMEKEEKQKSKFNDISKWC